MRQVATMKQKQDLTHFDILQINSILSTTTTLMLQILFVSTPPKRITKFKSFSLSAIFTNTF
jgi:hypothetical protein